MRKLVRQYDESQALPSKDADLKTAGIEEDR